MTIPVIPPRNYPGANDRAFSEFQKWVLAVSQAIGIDNPASIAELADFVFALMLKPDANGAIQQLKTRIEELDKQIMLQQRSDGAAQALKLRIDALEQQIALNRRYDGEILALKQRINDVESLVAMR